jgi:outer membrane protein OmpA-like peptidoglycan-associated protein
VKRARTGRWFQGVCLAGLLGSNALALADDCALARARQEAAKDLTGAARVRAYEAIVRLCADFSTLYTLGRAYQGTGEHRRALAQFDRALAAGSIEPRYRGYALARKAESLVALDHLPEALAAIEAARQAFGGDTPEWFAGIRRTIDAHPRRDTLSAAEMASVFSLLSKSYGVVPRIDLHIHFAFDSAALTAAGRRQVAELGRALERTADGYRITLVGHTDVRGADAYNQTLSEQRAAAVMAALLDGHPALRGRLQARGMGERRPLYPGTSEEEHRLNRRVEVSLTQALLFRITTPR